MKIYTKTGDKGETALLGGKKVSKSDLKIEAYGTIDELNSHIGLIKDVLSDAEQKVLLKVVQDTLFDIGSILAFDFSSGKKIKLNQIESNDVVLLENAIDYMNESLEELKNFILPGGHQNVSFIHIARCVCRRAERIIVNLNLIEAIKPELLQYINRLSDYLFVLARYEAKSLNADEIVWQSRKS